MSDSLNIRFLAEQTGDVENDLKAEVTRVLKSTTLVRAYLCNVQYNGSDQTSIAMCLVSGNGDDVNAIKQISNVFTQMFGSNEHLDLFYLTKAQEKQIREVCSPFYTVTLNGDLE